MKSNSRNITFSLLYVFIIAVISYHHHPANISFMGNIVDEKQQNEDNRIHQIQSGCSVIHFSASGFGHIMAENGKMDFIKSSPNYHFINNNYHLSKLFLNVSLRAPPKKNTSV